MGFELDQAGRAQTNHDNGTDSGLRYGKGYAKLELFDKILVILGIYLIMVGILLYDAILLGWNRNIYIVFCGK